MIEQFWLCFVPLFVAVDAIGVLPMFMNLIEGIDKAKVRKIIIQSVITAAVVAVSFLAIGKLILDLLNITVADFMIAGGALLFVISMNDMLTYEKKQHTVDPESLGAMPLGVPLIVGPAVLTTMILLLNENGFMMTVTAATLNILIAGLVFLGAGFFYKILGNAGAKTVSKLASLLLAAIAVMMIRKGVMIFILTSKM